MSADRGGGRGRLFSLLLLSLHLGQAYCGVSVGAAAGGAAHVLFGAGGGGGGGEPRERDEETEALVIFMMAAAAAGMREGYNVGNNRNCRQYFLCVS